MVFWLLLKLAHEDLWFQRLQLWASQLEVRQHAEASVPIACPDTGPWLVRQQLSNPLHRFTYNLVKRVNLGNAAPKKRKHIIKWWTTLNKQKSTWRGTFSDDVRRPLTFFLHPCAHACFRVGPLNILSQENVKEIWCSWLLVINTAARSSYASYESYIQWHTTVIWIVLCLFSFT